MISRLLKPANWPIWAFLASASMLGAAHASEYFLRLLACPLCLRQREVYWAAIVLSIISFAIVRVRPTARLIMTVNMMLCLAFLTGAVIAGYHTGVEWKFWPGPAECSAGIGEALPSSAAGMDLDQSFAIVSCSDAAWRMLGISMAGYNAVVSLVLAGLSAWFASKALSNQRPSLDLT